MGLDRYICVLVGKETARSGGGGYDRHGVRIQEGVMETQSENLTPFVFLQFHQWDGSICITPVSSDRALLETCSTL